MHLRITNITAKALDDYRLTFGSAGALELTNEYSKLAALPARYISFESSGKHVPSKYLEPLRRSGSPLLKQLAEAA